MDQLSCPIRMAFAVMSGLIWIGIALTGFGASSFLLYIAGIVTAVVAGTGLCMASKVMGRFCEK